MYIIFLFSFFFVSVEVNSLPLMFVLVVTLFYFPLFPSSFRLPSFALSPSLLSLPLRHSPPPLHSTSPPLFKGPLRLHLFLVLRTFFVFYLAFLFLFFVFFSSPFFPLLPPPYSSFSSSLYPLALFLSPLLLLSSSSSSYPSPPLPPPTFLDIDLISSSLPFSLFIPLPLSSSPLTLFLFASPFHPFLRTVLVLTSVPGGRKE